MAFAVVMLVLMVSSLSKAHAGYVELSILCLLGLGEPRALFYGIKESRCFIFLAIINIFLGNLGGSLGQCRYVQGLVDLQVHHAACEVLIGGIKTAYIFVPNYLENKLGLDKRGVNNVIEETTDPHTRGVCSVVCLLDKGKIGLVCDLVVLNVCCNGKH